MILTLLGDSYLFLTLVSGIDKMCDAYRKEIIKFNKKDLELYNTVPSLFYLT